MVEKPGLSFRRGCAASNTIQHHQTAQKITETQDNNQARLVSPQSKDQAINQAIDQAKRQKEPETMATQIVPPSEVGLEDEMEEMMTMEGLGDDMEMEMDGVPITDDLTMMEAFLDDCDDEELVGGATAATATATATGGSGNVRQVSDSTDGSGGIASLDMTTSTEEEIQKAIAAAPPLTMTPDPLTLTGRPSIPLYLSCNPDYLSEYQCLIRKNIELFEAKPDDVAGRIKGRNKPIVLGQVGIRCAHCAFQYPIENRARGAVYYPHKLLGIYQAAQILSQGHLLGLCPSVPDKLRNELQELKDKKSYATAGKEYWAETARVLGVYEDQYGLRFEKHLGIIRHARPH